MKSYNPFSFCILLTVFIGNYSLLLSQDLPGGIEETVKEEQIDKVFHQFADPKNPGAAVAVVSDGEIIFKKGYGSANLEYDIPNSPSTVFHIASVSKQFTAFSILLLAEQGKLSFDDDIRKYIPEVPDFGATITLRHLASHTSGLRDQWNLLAMAGWRLDDVITKEHVLKLVAKQKDLNFSPGEEYLYCNTGFTLLAEVVARVSGKSFAEFTQEHIFTPLGMERTLFYDDHEKIVKNRAYSYYSDDKGYKKSVLSYANVGATSLFTTVEDLSQWAINFSDIKVGSEAIINELNTLAVLNNGQTFGGAYGQFVNQHKGLKQIQHGGADAGYRTYLGRFPEQKFAVIVFCNYANSNPVALALNTADLYLKELLTSPNTDKKKPSFKTITLKSSQLKAFEGYYWNEEDSYSRRIYKKNDTLFYSRGVGNESPLAPIGENKFRMLNVEVNLEVVFELQSDEKRMIVTVDNGTPSIHNHYVPTNYSPKKLKQFTGVYSSDELSTSYVLEVKDDKLIATHSRLEDIYLNPIKSDRFSGNRWYFGDIQFERDQEQNIIGMKVSSGRVRNLRFHKQADK